MAIKFESRSLPESCGHLEGWTKWGSVKREKLGKLDGQWILSTMWPCDQLIFDCVELIITIYFKSTNSSVPYLAIPHGKQKKSDNLLDPVVPYTKSINFHWVYVWPSNLLIGVCAWYFIVFVFDGVDVGIIFYNTGNYMGLF